MHGIIIVKLWAQLSVPHLGNHMKSNPYNCTMCTYTLMYCSVHCNASFEERYSYGVCQKQHSKQHAIVKVEYTWSMQLASLLPHHCRDVPWCPHHTGSYCTHTFHQNTLIQRPAVNKRGKRCLKWYYRADHCSCQCNNLLALQMYNTLLYSSIYFKFLYQGRDNQFCQ